MAAAGIEVLGSFRIADGTAYDISPDAVPCCAVGHSLPDVPDGLVLDVDPDRLQSRQERIASVQAGDTAGDVAAAAAQIGDRSTIRTLHLWATILGAGPRRLIPIESITATDLAAAARGVQNPILRDALITWLTPDASLPPQTFGTL